MTPNSPEISDAEARVESLEVLAVLPGTALLTSKEAAFYINTTAEVLRVWRSQGKGPRFKGRGHFVRYLKSDLDEFMSGFDHRFDAAAAGA
jgi:helix-turn-helix protein